MIDTQQVAAPADDKDQRMADIEAFSLVIKEKRKDFIEGRRASGIEKIWQEDEDHYEGCDKFNGRYGMSKPRTTDGSFTMDRKKVVGRSTAFANITRPYCDAGAARVADMLLPTDDRNWALRPTPVPTLINGKDDQRGVAGPDGQPMMRPTQPHEMPQQQLGMLSKIGGAISGMFGGQQAPQAQPGQQPMQVVTVADMALQAIERAKASAERAQTEIDDWLVECRYHAEVRKVIECTARLGVGILKGPHPSKKKARAVSRTPDGWKMAMEVKIAPTSKDVSPWNFYPDPNCGDNIHNGSGVFERDDITARGLRDLKGTPGYIDDMIDMCLEDGPISSIDGAKKLRDNERVTDKDLFEIWYFNGQVSKKDMMAAGCECDTDMAPCIVTMVNDRIIKITMSPLDSGEFPYDVMVWQQKIGHWAGVGIARQMRTCQKALNGAIRALMDNMALSSGPQFIVDRSKIEPADGRWQVTPNKFWWKKIDGENMDDVRMAFTVVSIETRQQEILNAIQYWTKTAEDVTGLPMLIQGQQGKAPETVGGMTMLNNNATSVLRRIARTFDDRITEPHIGRYYEWLLLHGPDDAKGEFQIDARGSSALIERDIQNQAMLQLLGQAPNSIYGLDPEKVMKEVLKGMRLDPKSFTMDDEQKKAKASQPPPEDPRITAAKIVAQSKSEALKADAEQAQAQLQYEQDEAEKDRQLQLMTDQVNERIAGMKISGEKEISFADMKAMLAAKGMTLQVQQRLSEQSIAADLHKHHNPVVATPPTEPAGRAPNGEAYQR